ncbi:MAG: ABC transporter [Desulfobacteraceae bacterium A6]|nr:MAG: ABC transporter [Desulfobacteraceae bacterium A6]
MLSIRKIGVIGRTYRHLNRYRQILAVLFRYGFGDIIELLKIEQYIEIGLQMISRKRRERVEKLTRAERMRMAFEELGPTYIKLGQVLSTRPDLIPVDLTHELSKLQDEVPPFPFSDAKKIIESELGILSEEIFESLSEIPVASASIGQVHRARLKDGEEVAIKVQRPGIRKTIEVDLEIMLHLATLMERHVEEISFHRPVKIVEEFARTLEKEIDYTIEASNMERIGHQFLNDPTIYIPKVFHDFTTSHVLTMEYIEGIKVSEIDRIEEAGLDRKIITSRGADIYLKQIFDHGFFHADPHPGNIFILPGNIVCLLDFGMTGFVDRQTREDFVELIESVVVQSETKATQILLKITNWDDQPDVRLLERDVADFMGEHLYKTLKDIKIGKLLQHLLETTSRHRLRIPPNIFLMMKALSTVESVAVSLDPEFDMIEHVAPFVKRIRLDMFTPQRMTGEVMGIAVESLQFIRQFPKDMLEITRLMKNHKLGIKLEHHGLDTMLSTHNRVSNRISFSIIIAGLIIGSALVLASSIPPLFYGVSLIGIMGFVAAAFMGLWLLISMMRKGRL